MGKKSPARVLFNGLIGIIVFLILLGVLNILSYFVGNEQFGLIVEFFNSNMLLLILISIILLLGELFSVFIFPLNIIYPIFNAIGGALIVDFIFRLFDLIDFFSEQNISAALAQFYSITIVVVFLITIIVGYAHIFSFLRTKKSQIEKPAEKNTSLTISSSKKSENLDSTDSELEYKPSKPKKKSSKTKKRDKK